LPTQVALSREGFDFKYLAQLMQHCHQLQASWLSCAVMALWCCGEGRFFGHVLIWV
jgi:hypothetical protein